MLLVAQTRKALESIVAQVTETNEVIASIAASATEQATGLQLVNAAIGNMDQTTQKNAAMVEETTAASHALADEADELAKLMTHFRVSTPAADPLRRELKKAAPHAFRRPTAAGVSRPSVEPARRPALKAVASGGGAAAQESNWEEF